MSTWYQEHGYADVYNTGKPIWDGIWRVRVANKHIPSPEQLKRYGLPTAGDAYRDHQMHNELTVVMLTIDAIFENWRVGIPMLCVDNLDVERIYNTVYNYLAAWNRQLQTGVNIGGAPIEDLLKLDEWASELFTQSRMFNGARGRGNFSFIESLRKGGIGSLLNKNVLLGKGRDGNEIKPGAVDAHASFAESFASTQFIRARSAPSEVKPAGDRWSV